MTGLRTAGPGAALACAAGNQHGYAACASLPRMIALACARSTPRGRPDAAGPLSRLGGCGRAGRLARVAGAALERLAQDELVQRRVAGRARGRAVVGHGDRRGAAVL